MDQNTTSQTPEPADQDVRPCPYCAETIKSAAIKCRYCGSNLTAPAGNPLRDEWYRLREGKLLGGVCAGLAHHFDISVSLLRLAFIIGIPFSGAGLLIYLVLWIILPVRALPGAPAQNQPPWPPDGPTQ